MNPREQSAGRVDPSLSTNADRRWLTPVGADPKQHMKGPESRWAVNNAGSQAGRAPAVRCVRRAQGGTAVSHRGWRSCGLNLTGLTAFLKQTKPTSARGFYQDPEAHDVTLSVRDSVWN